jgi:hypothetical protein
MMAQAPVEATDMRLARKTDRKNEIDKRIRIEAE